MIDIPGPATTRRERREPRLFVRSAACRASSPAVPPGARDRVRDYAPPTQPVRPVLTPMMRPQTIVDPGPTVPFVISAALHVAVLAFLLATRDRPHGSPSGTQPPQVEMVFDAPPSRSSMRGPRSRDDAGEPPPATQSRQSPAPEPPQQRQDQPSAPMPAVPTPETPSSPPVAEAPSGELAKSEPSPAPVTPAPVPSQRTGRAAARSHRHAQRETRPDRNNPFAHPMDLSFGEQPSRSRHRRGRAAGSGGPIDMSVGPLSMNGAINAPYQTRSSVRGVSEDYGGEIDRWIRSHMYYPEEAARAGEDGPSSVHVVLDRFGHVKTVRLTGQSGSYALDAATTGMFQGAHLPPVPPDMKGDHFDIDVTIDYILIRH